MKTIKVPIPRTLQHMEPIIAFGDIINAFSSYYQYAIPETPTPHKDGHIQTVAYTQELISKMLFTGSDSGLFMEEIEIPYHSECFFLIEGSNFEMTIKILNRVWDCYLLHNEKVYASGEIADIFEFTALRDELCSLVIAYHLEANRKSNIKDSGNFDSSTQEN